VLVGTDEQNPNMWMRRQFRATITATIGAIGWSNRFTVCILSSRMAKTAPTLTTTDSRPYASSTKEARVANVSAPQLVEMMVALTDLSNAHAEQVVNALAFYLVTH
jgi:hypothetical protein